MAWLEIRAQNLGSMEAACDACGLLFLREERGATRSPLRPESMPAWLRREVVGRQIPDCSYIIQVNPSNTETFAVIPYLVRVYEKDDFLVLVWENHPDGYGLHAFFKS